MLLRARDKTGLRGRLVRADCQELPIRTGAADFVVCSFALGYVTDLARLACEMARVARPTASILVSDFHPSGFSRGWKRAFCWGGQTVEIASHRCTVGQILRAFDSAGLSVRRRVEPCLGEPERRFFESGGKSDLFEEATGSPAVLILDLRPKTL
jgi:ubiquinone/menaquinone biosynthesis C-methylase UbiE